MDCCCCDFCLCLHTLVFIALGEQTILLMTVVAQSGCNVISTLYFRTQGPILVDWFLYNKCSLRGSNGQIGTYLLALVINIKSYTLYANTNC